MNTIKLWLKYIPTIRFRRLCRCYWDKDCGNKELMTCYGKYKHANICRLKHNKLTRYDLKEESK